MIRKTKIIVVDDSAFMRKAIEMMLREESSFEIVATANNGEDALKYIRELKPDVVTLDIEMPGMTGLEVLERIMKDMPTPVIMISSLSTEGADETIKALELGAVDFIPKSLSYVSLDIVKIKDTLIEKIKNIRSLSKSIIKNVMSPRKKLPVLSLQHNKIGKKIRFIAIGISTGGPRTLQEVIPRLPKDFPRPVMVVQHMPPKFTKSLAERLDKMSEVRVKEAEHHESVKSGTVYIAPGGKHMKLKKNGTSLQIEISDTPDNTLHRPSVDIMLESIVDIYGSQTLSVIMTGMGKDGLKGSNSLYGKNGMILSESEESCVVYGMPKAVVEAGIVDRIEPATNIAEAIMDYVRQ